MAGDGFLSARERLHRELAARAATPPKAWHARVWARAVLLTHGGDDEAVTETLRREWAAFRAAHPGEPEVTFAPPADLPAEVITPGPPSYDSLVPLVFGRYGNDFLQSHDERVRDEQERLARRDQVFYGF